MHILEAMFFVDVDGTFRDFMRTILVHLFCGLGSVITYLYPGIAGKGRIQHLGCTGRVAPFRDITIIL